MGPSECHQSMLWNHKEQKHWLCTLYLSVSLSCIGCSMANLIGLVESALELPGNSDVMVCLDLGLTGQRRVIK